MVRPSKTRPTLQVEPIPPPMHAKHVCTTSATRSLALAEQLVVTCKPMIGGRGR